MSLFPIIAAACPELGTNPVRFYEGVAPQESAFPYATWQVVGGTPSNDLAGHAHDQIRYQIDVWGRTETRTLANAMRAALDSHGYVVWFDSSREEDLYRTTFHFEVIE